MKSYIKAKPVIDEEWQNGYKRGQNSKKSDNLWIVRLNKIGAKANSITLRYPNNLKKGKIEKAGINLADILKEEKIFMTLLEERNGQV